AAALRPYSPDELKAMPLKVEWDTPVPGGKVVVAAGVPEKPPPAPARKPELSAAQAGPAPTASGLGKAPATAPVPSSGGFPTAPPASPATAPAALALPRDLSAAFQRLMEESRGVQRGGLLVRGPQG